MSFTAVTSPGLLFPKHFDGKALHSPLASFGKVWKNISPVYEFLTASDSLSCVEEVAEALTVLKVDLESYFRANVTLPKTG